jgi:hypothetical protein
VTEEASSLAVASMDGSEDVVMNICRNSAYPSTIATASLWLHQFGTVAPQRP